MLNERTSFIIFFMLLSLAFFQILVVIPGFLMKAEAPARVKKKMLILFRWSWALSAILIVIAFIHRLVIRFSLHTSLVWQYIFIFVFLINITIIPFISRKIALREGWTKSQLFLDVIKEYLGKHIITFIIWFFGAFLLVI